MPSVDETSATTGLSYRVKGFDVGVKADSLTPGEGFKPTWTILNNGSLAWSGDYQLVYVDRQLSRTSGYRRAQMAERASYSLRELTGCERVEPDEEVTMTLEMASPNGSGFCASHWELRDEAGNAFGGTRYVVIEVKAEDKDAEGPGDTFEEVDGPYEYRGPKVKFYTGLHGPADDGAWLRSGFKSMIETLNLPLVFMSNGINPDFAGLGDPKRNVVRLYWNPEAVTADQAYEYIRDDQLKRWWQRGYRRFIFFNEPQLTIEHGQSHEGMGIAWHSADEFGQYLSTCLRRARKEFNGIYLYTTPVTSNQAFDPWGWRAAIWRHTRRLVDGWCMHAYSGNNSDAEAAVNEILNQVKELQRRFNLQIPIIVSEASVNRGADAEQKAKVALLLAKKAVHIPGLQAVFWYAADWDPGFDKHHEGWFRNGIYQAYLRQRR